MYKRQSPYNGDSGTLDSARGVMFIILAAIGIAWIDALITFVFEVGYVAKRGKLKAVSYTHLFTVHYRSNR